MDVQPLYYSFVYRIFIHTAFVKCICNSVMVVLTTSIRTGNHHASSLCLLWSMQVDVVKSELDKLQMGLSMLTLSAHRLLDIVQAQQLQAQQQHWLFGLCCGSSANNAHLLLQGRPMDTRHEH